MIKLVKIFSELSGKQDFFPIAYSLASKHMRYAQATPTAVSCQPSA
ncbi:hypothetical protein [Moorena bouillonii]|nr:hypothetical protein [Moorena bouillonii]